MSQRIPHTPAPQVAVAFGPAGHVTPQPPQFAMSALVSMQVPSHSDCPDAQVLPSAGATRSGSASPSASIDDTPSAAMSLASPARASLMRRSGTHAAVVKTTARIETNARNVMDGSEAKTSMLTASGGSAGEVTDGSESAVQLRNQNT